MNTLLKYLLTYVYLRKYYTKYFIFVVLIVSPYVIRLVGNKNNTLAAQNKEYLSLAGINNKKPKILSHRVFFVFFFHI